MVVRLFFDSEIAIVVSTVFALFWSWDAQRQYRQPNLLRRIWTWRECELTFFGVFTSILGILAGFYVVEFLSSLMGIIGGVQFILRLAGGLIGMEVTQRLIVKKLRTQFIQAKRDLETSSSPPES